MSSTFSRSAEMQVHPEPGWKTILECATIEVFEMMANTRLQPTSAQPAEPAGDRTAMVGMAGALCGMTTLRCSNQLALKLASLMLGSDAASNPATVGDALGELCNMVAGNFKSKVSNLADHCMLSVPTVITGESYSMQTLNPVELFQLSLLYDNDPIWVSLIVHS